MTMLSCLERWLPETTMRKIKLLRMVWKYPYHFSTYAAALFDEPVSQAEVEALKAGLPPESCAAIDRYLKLRKLTEDAVFGYFPMVDLRTLRGGPEGSFELQRRRLKTCLKKFPVLRRYPSELLRETILAHGLVLASPGELAYIRGRDFVDAGACRGESSLLMTEFAPRRIYAFEPVPEFRETMRRTIAAAGGDTEIRICPEALGAASGEAEFWLDDIGSALAETGKARPGHAIRVQVRSLDELLAQAHQDADIGFVKADIEGAGRAALAGMRETIRRSRPILSIAIYHNKDEFLGVKADLAANFPDYRIRILSLNPANIANELYLWAVPAEIV